MLGWTPGGGGQLHLQEMSLPQRGTECKQAHVLLPSPPGPGATSAFPGSAPQCHLFPSLQFLPRPPGVPPNSVHPPGSTPRGPLPKLAHRTCPCPQTKSQHLGFPSWATTVNRGCRKDSPPAAFHFTWGRGPEQGPHSQPTLQTHHGITLPWGLGLAGLRAQQLLTGVTPDGTSCQLEEGPLTP